MRPTVTKGQRRGPTVEPVATRPLALELPTLVHGRHAQHVRRQNLSRPAARISRGKARRQGAAAGWRRGHSILDSATSPLSSQGLSLGPKGATHTNFRRWSPWVLPTRGRMTVEDVASAEDDFNSPGDGACAPAIKLYSMSFDRRAFEHRRRCLKSRVLTAI